MAIRTEVIQPAIVALVELGNGIGGIRISSSDRAATRKNLNDAFEASKASSKRTVK